MDHQLLQHCLQPGPVVRQLRVEVLDVVAGRDGAAHRNTPRRPGARAGWFLPMADCMPEGKNRALTVIQRSKQAFVSLGPLIQLGSSQLPTKASENRIWPVRRPLEAAAAASRVRGDMGTKGLPPVAAACHCCTDSRHPKSKHQPILHPHGLVFPVTRLIQ